MVSLADIPVKLTIKAPNQRVDDMAVECMLGWTVKKLKQHLQSVYPNSPKEDEQKLIYSGKLMDDHLTLKEILRQLEEIPNHTVHLVCMPTTESDQARAERLMSSSSSSSNSSLPEAEGLRNRIHTHSTTEQNMGHMNPGIYGTNPLSATGLPYSPEQYLYYQQMYAQYMSHYYQYYQTGQTGVYPAHYTPVTETTGTPPPVNQIPQQREGPRNAAPANQNIRMNAQGGAVMDDEDEEFGNRDWLDWVYVLCRFFVLMSIVYFYSTFRRFLVVFTLFFLIYLYQTGWFRFRQRNEEIRDGEQQQEQEQPEQPPQEEQPEQPPQERREDEEPQQQQNVSQAEEQTEQVPMSQAPPAPPAPSAMIVAWNFCTTLFTSLVPQQPEAVNVN